MKPVIRRDQIAAMNWHYRRFSLDYFLDTVERIGYTAVAIWAGPPFFHIDSEGFEDPKPLLKKLRNHHLRCASLTAVASQELYQIGVSGKAHMRDAVRYFINGARVAAELETDLLTANPGHGYYDEARSDSWNRAVDTLGRVCDGCAQYGVKVTVEGLRPPETRTAWTLSHIKQLLMDVNRPNCLPMIDTTAMAVNGETVWDWFHAFGGNIANTHFVDAAPAGHLAWGDGILPLEDMLRCINRYGYSGPLGLEITDRRYFADPGQANEQCFRVLSQYIAD